MPLLWQMFQVLELKIVNKQKGGWIYNIKRKLLQQHQQQKNARNTWNISIHLATEKVWIWVCGSVCAFAEHLLSGNILVHFVNAPLCCRYKRDLVCCATLSITLFTSLSRHTEILHKTLCRSRFWVMALFIVYTVFDIWTMEQNKQVYNINNMLSDR